MKWLYIILALLAGLGLGYLIFTPSPEMAEADGHQHDAAMTSPEARVWTCTMHPQIRQPEPGLCPICEMDLIPLAQTMTDDPMVLKMTEQAVALARISTTEVGASAGGGDTLVLNGKVQADERRTLTQTAHVPAGSSNCL